MKKIDEEGRQEFLHNYNYFSYELTDLQTNQTFTSKNYLQGECCLRRINIIKIKMCWALLLLMTPIVQEE